VSVSSLSLAAQNPTARPAPIPGTPRSITVTNTGAEVAQLVGLDPGYVLPAGTSIVSSCSTLAPSASCQFTITPGTTTTVTPVTLNIRGNNTNTVATAIQVLGYGSTYQGGYVFALDDATPATGSVAGKVAGLNDVALALPWAPDNNATGLDENAAAPCNGNSDGACNTQYLVTLHPANLTTYAAGACEASAAEGYSDWYLPAICEMGHAGGSVSVCGTQAVPAQQNIQTSLVEGSSVPGVAQFYWSSTEAATSTTSAWAEYFNNVALNSQQAQFIKSANSLPVRCVRAFTP